MSMNKKTAQPSARPRKKARPAPAPDRENSEALAEMVLQPSLNAAAVVSQYTKPMGVEDTDVGALMDQLQAHEQGLWAGDMKRAEAMLCGQAHALQAIFVNLARRAQSQQYLAHWEAYLRMALKAQNQCRMTLETLATIKNPPVVIARQANINNGGQQQVNNGTAPAAGREPSRAGNPEAAQTGLLERDQGEHSLDTAPTGRSRWTRPDPLPVGDKAQ
jgi:hypothetical protein